MDNDFLKARAMIQGRIKHLETQIETLRDELSAFDRVEITMRRLAGPARKEAQAFELEPMTGNSATTQASDLAPAERVSLRQMVLEYVSSKKEPVAATEVENALLKNGYKPGGANFDISIVKALNKFVDDGILNKIRGEKRRVTFALK